jgi:branched-chain amino acid transport system substrate-binding protein
MAREDRRRTATAAISVARKQEGTMHGKTFVALAAAGVALAAASASAENAPGASATEIRIGQTMPYSGPASAYAVIGKFEALYFNMLNEQGGINGRKIVLLSRDDDYNPAKTLEATRRLVEEDHVAFIFGSLGTAPNTAIEKYLNDHKVPQLFVASGADKFGNHQDFPWTMGFQPSYRIEAQIYARYILKARPNAKIGVFYQNDDFGKDYIRGLKDVLGDRYAKMVVKEASYEVSDATVDSEIIALQSAGADTLVSGATPKFAAMAIRKVDALGWKPLHFLTNVSVSVSRVIEPAGPESAVGIISAIFQKDPHDPAVQDDPALAEYRQFMQRYMPDADAGDIDYIFGYSESLLLVHLLKQCGHDLSRENVMRQAANLRNVELPSLLPGIRVNTSPANYHPVQQMQLMRWSGKSWKRFGDVLGDEQF